jgi:hypothetical protein
MPYLSKAHLGLRVPVLEVVVTAHHPGTDVGATNHLAHVQLTPIHSYRAAVAVVPHPSMPSNGVATRDPITTRANGTRASSVTRVAAPDTKPRVVTCSIWQIFLRSTNGKCRII